MYKTNILLIINPKASKGKGEAKAKKIAAYFRSCGLECTVAYTGNMGHAEKLARSGVENGFRIVVAAGGDGTVNEVINGIMRSGRAGEVKMGIIPVGRGNDFAWVAGIPSNYKKACDIIVKGESKATDVGYAKGSGQKEGKYFLNGMGFGFEPLVNFKAQEYRFLNGMASYVAAFFSILFNPPKGYDFMLTIDGEKREMNSQQLSFNSGRRMGSSFLMTPKAVIDDGVFDYMFPTRNYKGFGLISLVVKFLRGAMIREQDDFSYGNARTIVIDTVSCTIPAHVDGEEFTKEGRHFEVSVLPGAVNLLR